MYFAVPVDHRVKIKENEKKETNRSCRTTKKENEHEGAGDTNYYCHTWNNPLRLIKSTRGVVNRRMSGNHPVYSVVEISQNTEKSPGDLRTLRLK